MQNPQATLVPLSQQQPQADEQERGLLVMTLQLNTRDVVADPWTSEHAHVFPSSGRVGSLVNTLKVLEPVLNQITR